ncbi:MAG: methyl-accepting chemotaxis protein [Undibacterium sp.]|uniref:methyl-accepting chemotaxis protein n=1 Tax=Undibacterium sp. TaxID=1914977 RepID=UPI0027161ABA|nr:methyl-accepting chemotaxis protein [Undibacterium sp.]MDO8653784.1 methyl-accepting chemotaxis protein [Undibacterium sp.]
MRNNQPVTGNAYPLRDDQSLISRTDAQGNITYVNEDFITLSGFSEAELIGSPHNMVRHPDMPAEAFADMWSTLKSGNSWTGMVKNRRKDGDHYWVLANATPIREAGIIVGYTSVRTAPTQDQITQASVAYARFKNGEAGRWQIRQGQVLRRGIIGKALALKNLTIQGRLILLISLLCMVMTGIGAMGLYGMNSSNEGLRTVYQDRTIPLGQLDMVVRLLQSNRLLLSEAIYATNPEEIKSTAGKIEVNIGQVNKNWDAYMASYLTPEEKKLADKFVIDRANFVNRGLTPAIAALNAGNIEEVKRLEHDVIGSDFNPVREGINALIQLQLDVSKQESDSAQANFIFMRNFISMVIVLGILLSFFAARLLIGAIVHPLNQAVNLVREIAAGNLSATINIKSNDEMGHMQHALNVMNKSLTNIISGVRHNAEIIGSTSIQIADGNNDLSQRTEEQASTLEETAASMEELTSTVKSNAENSKQARELAHTASHIAVQGGEAMSLVVGTMDSIADSSKKITDIISVIDGIAFQTNILALNAAVEAARAGEQGRGFAVVASEVRSLAQRSASAAKEIKELIGDSVSKVATGAKQVIDARKTIDGVVIAVQQVSDIMSDITAASMEQSIGIEQVNQAVMQMDEVTQQNAALVEEAAAAAESLQTQGHALVQAMAVFTLSANRGVDVPGRAINIRPSAVNIRRASVTKIHSAKIASAQKNPVRRAIAANNSHDR